MNRSKTQKMVGVAMLGAVGFVLMIPVFPIIPGFPFMQVDFSEIPILISTYLFGPLAGVLTAFMRSVLHYILTGGDLSKLIGDATSFVAALTFVLPVYYFTKNRQTKKSLIIGFFISTIFMTVAMSIVNYFVALPLYFKVLNFDVGMPYAKYVLIGVVPFNLIKGALVSTVFLMIHAKLLPWLQKKTKVKRS